MCEFPPEWFENTYYPVKRKWLLWLRALGGQVMRVKYYDENDKLIMAGWWDPREQKTYITYLWPLEMGVDVAKK